MNQVETDWKLLDIVRGGMTSTGKSQARFVAALLTFLAILWAHQFVGNGGTAGQEPLSLFGFQIRSEFLWTLAPFVLTVLTLALIGTMNLMGPTWRRLGQITDRLGHKLFWTDLDEHKTIIDYLTQLRIHPEGSVQPIEPPADNSRKYDWTVFSYPAVIAFSIFSTIVSDYESAPLGYKFYVYGCAALQSIYSVRIFYRAICRFFAVRRAQTEI